MTFPDIRYINDRMIFGETDDIHHFYIPNKLLPFAGLNPNISIGLATFNPKQHVCPNETLMYYDIISLYHSTLCKITRPSRLIMILSELKSKLTTTFLDISSSEASRKYFLTMWNSTLSKRASHHQEVGFEKCLLRIFIKVILFTVDIIFNFPTILVFTFHNWSLINCQFLHLIFHMLL